MPDAAHQQLEAFVRQSCGKVAVRFRPPAPADVEPGVCFVLIGLAPNLIVRRDARRPLQAHRRYLVCATGPDTAASAALVEALMFGALEQPDLQLESDPPSNDLWIA